MKYSKEIITNYKYLKAIAIITIVFMSLVVTDFSNKKVEKNTKSVEAKWKVVGQGGGGVLVDIVCHPTDSNIVWVLTDLTGIFKSTDGGATYTRKTGKIEREELLFEWTRGAAHELVYDLSDPNIMYWAMDGGIYTTPGLYKSTDGGENWFKIPESPDLAPGAIVVDYNGVIYGFKHKKFYVSKNKGETWLNKPDVPTYYSGDDYDWRRRLRHFIYVTKDNKVIIGDRYKGTGIYITENMGDSWTQALKGTEIMDVACSPTTPSLVMALEQDGRIFRSADGGKNFEMVEKISNSYYTWGKWPAYFGGIAINKKDHVMAIGRWELGLSLDGGKTFKVIEEKQSAWDPGDYIFINRSTNNDLFKCNKLTVSFATGNWYSVDGMIVKKSSDNGESWYGYSKGLDILCVYSPPVVDATNPDIIHIPAGDNGYYYTTDGGVSWKTPETRMGNVDGLDQDPNNPAVWYKMYGRNDRGAIHKSTDGGVTWKKLTNIPVPDFKGRSVNDPSFYSGYIGWLAVDPTNSQRIFATHRASDGLYMSEDGGHNFRRVLELVRPWQLEVTDKGTVFICTWDSKGLYRSTDHGKSFETIHDGMVHDFVVHPDNDDIVYAKTWVSIHGSHRNYHPRGFVYGGVPGRVYSWNHNLERIDNIHVDSLFIHGE